MTSLKNWEENRWLKPHKTSPQEIENLLAIVTRDIEDASHPDLSPDWKFGIAYNAVLKLCTVLLYSEGYRAARVSNHYYTIQALPLIMGDKYKDDAIYLDMCRIKRNTVEYDYAGGVTEAEAMEIIAFVEKFRAKVLAWLEKNHPELTLTA